jgi:hypothetical protein
MEWGGQTAIIASPAPAHRERTSPGAADSYNASFPCPSLIFRPDHDRHHPQAGRALRHLDFPDHRRRRRGRRHAAVAGRCSTAPTCSGWPAAPAKGPHHAAAPPRGQVEELTPAPFNVRTRVHEYGGGATRPRGQHGLVLELRRQPRLPSRPRPAAAARPRQRGRRRALGRLRARTAPRRLVGVREDHAAGEAYPVNTLCAVGFDGTRDGPRRRQRFLFVAAHLPGRHQLAWLCWDHPRMPWQGTELWLADIAPTAAWSTAA